MAKRLTLIVAIAWLAGLAAITLLVIDPAKYPLIAAVRSAGGLPSLPSLLSVLHQQFGVFEYSLFGIVVVLSVFLVLIEGFGKTISAILLDQTWMLLVLYFALAVWLGHSYLDPGKLLMGDSAAHIVLATLLESALTQHQFPYWTNFLYLGQPLPEFYSPTSFWLIAWLATAIGDSTVATKLFMLLAHVLSGFCSFALMRQMGMSRLCAFFGGLIFVGSFAHLHQVLYRGTIPQALCFAFFPLALLFLHRVMTSQGHLNYAWIGLSLSSAALLVNYLPFGIAAGFFMALFAIGLLLSGIARWARLVPVMSASAMAVVLAAFVVLPVAAAASFNNANLSAGNLWRFGLPTAAYFNHLLIWRAWRTNFAADSAAYLGITTIILALLGLYRAWRDPDPATDRRTLLLIFALLILSGFTRGDKVRDIIFVLCFVSVLAAFGAGFVLHRSSRIRSGPAILLALLVLDLGSTAVQPVARTDLTAIETAGHFLAGQPPTRTLVGDIENGRFVPTDSQGQGLIQLYPAEFVTGMDLGLVPHAHVFGDLAGPLVQADFDTHHQLQQDTRDFLCLLRIGQIVASRRTEMGLPDSIKSTEVDGPLGRVVKTHCSYQVIFSTALSPAGDNALNFSERPNAEELQRLRSFLVGAFSRMDFDPRTGTASHILVRGTADGAPARAEAKPPRVEDYAVSSGAVNIRLSATFDGYVRLSHPWYPRLRVTRNGRLTEPLRDFMDFIVIPVVAGENRITILPTAEPAQIAGNRISLAALLTVIGLAIFLGRERFRPSPVRLRGTEK